eukprot:scaffold58310_cov20-Tisochrysis_lutea.AAC.1
MANAGGATIVSVSGNAAPEQVAASYGNVGVQENCSSSLLKVGNKVTRRVEKEEGEAEEHPKAQRSGFKGAPKGWTCKIGYCCEGSIRVKNLFKSTVPGSQDAVIVWDVLWPT